MLEVDRAAVGEGVDEDWGGGPGRDGMITGGEKGVGGSESVQLLPRSLEERVGVGADEENRRRGELRAGRCVSSGRTGVLEE